jgi:hypothetical protein
MKRRDGETDAAFLARFAQAAAARADGGVTDLWQLQRDRGESDSEYAERAKMLGCDPDGMIRLRRGQRDE